jgi:hypothetical protein
MNFSLRKLATPSPPFPAIAWITASSMYFIREFFRADYHAINKKALSGLTGLLAESIKFRPV